MKAPVALFLFKRYETLERIFQRVREYRPEKLYLLGDGPRNEEESFQVDIARKLAIKLVDWDCEVITKFNEYNVGVYNNIGVGAKWVLQHEDVAIFLEDDNLPEVTFFDYCNALLEKYYYDKDVLWICGTNYMVDSSSINDDSYYYTRHLLPCGWASWSSKFLRYYDGELSTLTQVKIDKMKSTYQDLRLFSQELQTIKQTRFNYLRNPKSVSWDRQMCFSVRSNLLYGIAPCKNQIKNIGADEHSVHGGTSLKNEMTARFCERETIILNFPLHSPKAKEVNAEFERLTSEIILYPLKSRIKRHIGRVVKRLVGLDPDDSLVLFIKNLNKNAKP